MFGHQDSNNQDAQQAAPTTDGILSHPVGPQTYAPTASTPLPATEDADNYIMTDVSTPQPVDVASTPPVTNAPVPAPAVTLPAAEELATAPAPVAADGAPANVDTGLLEIKQSALQELTPLIDHLEQTAEEKFRTMMMMIQASDDQTLLADAYHAAQSIEDKKARAQALLDIVNEINYFTQQHPDGGTPAQ